MPEDYYRTFAAICRLWSIEEDFRFEIPDHGHACRQETLDAVHRVDQHRWKEDRQNEALTGDYTRLYFRALELWQFDVLQNLSELMFPNPQKELVTMVARTFIVASRRSGDFRCIVCQPNLDS